MKASDYILLEVANELERAMAEHAPCPYVPCRGAEIERRFPGFRRSLPVDDEAVA